MSVADATLRMILLGEDRGASAALKRLGDAATATDAKLAAVSGGMVSSGRKMTHAFTLPGIAIAALSIKTATDFNSAMTRIQTQAGASASDVKLLSAQILALGGKVQQTPVELANAMYHLKSVGLDNAAAMKALAASSKLAAVGNADLEETTNALAGAWRTGIKGAQNFHGAVATLNAIIGAGNMTMEDLNAAIGTGFLPAAKTFGLSLHDVGAALAVMTDEGIPADAAATRLRMSFSLLGAPSAKAAGLLDGIGISASKLAHEMRDNGLVGAIGLLKEHMKGMSKVAQSQLISRAFGGGRSSAAIMTLLNNFDVLKFKEDQVTKGMGRFGDSVAKQMETPQAKFHMLVSTLETAGVELGNVLLPAAISAANGLKGLIEGFQKLPSPVQKAAGDFALFLVALGPILTIGGRLLNFYLVLKRIAIGIKLVAAAQWLWNAAMAANPVVLIIAAIVLLGVALVVAYKKSETFRNIVNGALHAVAAAFQWVVGFIKDHWQLLMVLLGGAIGIAVVLIIKNFDKVQAAIRAVAAVGRWLWNGVFQPVFHFLAGALADLISLWAHMLSALSHVPGFGWAKDAANALQHAADTAHGLADAITKIPSHKDVSINIYTHHIGGAGGTNSQNQQELPTGPGHPRSFFGKVGPSAVVPAVGLDGRTSGGSGGDLGTVTFVLRDDSGREIQRKLLRLKRENGGLALGLA